VASVVDNGGSGAVDAPFIFISLYDVLLLCEEGKMQNDDDLDGALKN
jgi:hypothetical protein